MRQKYVLYSRGSSGHFGALVINENEVTDFHEKPSGDGGLINGGCLACEYSFFDYISGDDCVLEHEPLRKLSSTGI